jgi:short-subunit dehydrogenase
MFGSRKVCVHLQLTYQLLLVSNAIADGPSQGRLTDKNLADKTAILGANCKTSGPPLLADAMHSNKHLSLQTVLAGCAGCYVAMKLMRDLVLRAQLALGPSYLDKIKGQWALITGSSEGVGLAIADALAARGINVMLVSRSPDKLAKAAKQLSAKHADVQIDYASTDLTSPNAADKLLEQLMAQDRAIALLINNAGGSVDSAKLYHQFPEEEQSRIQALNGTIAYTLTKRLLPSMLERGQGAVVAISSQAVVMPCFMAPYAAEKAKLESLYTALNIELQGTGVTAQALRLGAVLTPGLISTQVTSSDPHAADDIKPSLLVPTPAVVAKQIVRAIGKGTGPVYTPYLPHALTEGLLTSIWPPGLQRRVLRSLASSIKDSWDAKLHAKATAA